MAGAEQKGTVAYDGLCARIYDKRIAIIHGEKQNGIGISDSLKHPFRAMMR